MNVIDDSHRDGVTIEVGSVIRTLNQLLEWRKKPLVFLCDNGPEFISHRFVRLAIEDNIRIEYIEPDKLQQNAYIELYNRIIRYIG